jgi:hypothetical protein
MFGMAEERRFRLSGNEILPLHSVQGQNDTISMYSIFKAMTFLKDIGRGQGPGEVYRDYGEK